MCPLVFPDGQGLDADASVQQDVVSNVVHRHLGLDEMAVPAFEDDGDVCVALIMRRATGSAAEQNGLLRGIAFCHALDKSARGFDGVGGERYGSHWEG